MGNAGALILYRNFEQGHLFSELTWILENYRNDLFDAKDVRARYYECAHELVEFSASHGFEGNLWHCFLTFLIVNHENAYSLACEKRGAADGSIRELALHDFRIFKKLFDFHLRDMAAELGLEAGEIEPLLAYAGVQDAGIVFGKRIRDCICELAVTLGSAANPEAFRDAVADFYQKYGVGQLGLHKAFRIAHGEDGVKLCPITKIAHVQLDDLVGYESAKKKLIENTEAFVRGKKANNCLLFGDSGTGKSTSIKAIVNQYYDEGLRMIEVYKHQFQDLNAVISLVKNRNYRFILYMDDLSFEEFETDYKYLKAVIEGGLEKKPENILIYATSNRRHLIRENYSDKEEVRQDMHTSDTVQEKLSLAYRFGLTIYFGAPDPKEFGHIVTELAKRQHVAMDREQLLEEASRWELRHGGLSGRTAQQFIQYCLLRE